ncbi:MAG: HD-GYP domain-containing protein, partial [Rhizobiales bacterium]|nr:HD-GYP domain-containing protein [Rhizobacter sp.]
ATGAVDVPAGDPTRSVAQRMAEVSIHSFPSRNAAPSADAEAARAAPMVSAAKQCLLSLFDDVRQGRTPDFKSCRPVVEDIAHSLARNPSALVGVVRHKKRDDYTAMHSVAVCTLMVSLARKLALGEEQVLEAGMAGLLHDLGKAMIPSEIIDKPGALTNEEFAIVKRHPQLGHDILRGSGGIGESVLRACLQHHERPDGKGYPNQLADSGLTLHARMAAVCDVYDAITSDRPYRGGQCPSESLAHMAQWTRGGQFDASVFRAFIDCVGVFPVGSLVRLHSHRLAVVVENTPSSSRAPRIRAFYSLRSGMPVATETIDLSAHGCRDFIVGRESNDKWKFTQLAELTFGHAG